MYTTVAAYRRLADALLQQTQEGIAVTDRAGAIVAVNPAFCAISEYSQAELIGRSIRMLSPTRGERTLWHELAAAGRWQGEVWSRRKGGEVYPQWLAISAVPDESGAPANYVLVVTDVTRMRRARSHLDFSAYHDPLTGLANRSLLRLRLAHSIEHALRERRPCAVLFVDLDRFKQVNDARGHRAGDEVLRLVARRIARRLRRTDTAARLGGDEFVVVLEGIAAPEAAARTAAALAAELARPFRLADGGIARIGASIGISLCPADGRSPEALIHSADEALYCAKAAGGGTWRFAESPSPVPAPQVRAP